MSTNPPLLRAEALFHHRCPPAELNGVSLGVGCGGFTLLHGDAGAGLLLRVLGLLERPDAGEVWFDGQPTGVMDEGARLEMRNRLFGFLFAEPFLLDSFSVAENVAMPLFRIACLDIEQARMRTAEVLEFAGLAGAADAGVADLSRPDQHKVSLARALAITPRLLIAEDVGLHLPEEDLPAFAELLRSVPEVLGIAVLATSPAGTEIFGADRRVRIEGGVIVEDSEPAPAQEAPAHD
jgi:ABC-type lipoprotein export system ATPase subunit